MKKFLFSIALTLGMLIGFSDTADAQNIFYRRVDVYNGAGVNATDFVFTYDQGNKCSNNFKVVNNLGVRTYFNFKIYIDGNWMYTGYVEVNGYSSVFFNNAFVNCYSERGNITVRAW
ncbi:MAG: hypothetical protein SLAVMIC_00828 [uncultured marine phage]|uniref:Uncharacterized protein n=1 Tax=uncultured marine phage TaxID=707152 RepID=A0A8D9C9M4_9VIRU|nr:MAG: hypothetical protein SLAVMIC_00828 [uncultured marine phage]